ncbi:hypothetical protein [Salinisphaera orenii]|uniref:Uncharacterized protein n=1 Tax=Salinisphaera orenii YIM 95161 TaxID=1051139 RepID=A0A423PRR4_9GAMM|nr:hypothetical protein [Salinisphaera halophila]ROO28268.1 hypothetical protein SAHL_10700 [Salinisphaera halophila YIM 95161]
MTGATYHLRRRHDGREAGTVRVRADSPRAAFERVRRERPAYARDQLILCGVEAAR